MTKRERGRREPNRALARVGISHPNAAACIKAISAPQRRRILRALHDAGEARSPVELSKAFEISVGHVSYHVKVLKECGVLALTDAQPRRGAVEHFYGSTVIDNDLILKLLEATRTGDE